MLGTLSNKCRSIGRTVPKPKLTPEEVYSFKGTARFRSTLYTVYHSKLRNLIAS